MGSWTNVGNLRGQGARRRETTTREGAKRTSRLTLVVAAGTELARQLLSVQALPLNLLAFLVGRATVLQSLTPFGLAFFAAVLHLCPRRGLGAGLAAAAGVLSAGAVGGGLQFAGTVAGLGLLLLAFERQLRVKGGFMLAALTFTVTVIAGSVRAALVDPTPYSFLMACFGGLLTFVLTLVYLAALPPLVSLRRPISLGPEQIVALAVTAATALAGLSGLGYGAMRASGVADGVIILAAAILCGGGVGAAVGTVAGVVAALCGAGGLASVGLAALSGLLAGSFREFGKLGSVAGYFFGTLLLSPLVEQPSYLRGVVLECALATVIVLAVPARFFALLGEALGQNAPGASAAGQESSAQEHTGQRLVDFGLVFGQLAATLRELTAGTVAVTATQDVGWTRPDDAPAEMNAASLAEAACRVCETCRLFRSCWKGDSERTRDSMAGLLAITVERGQLEARDVPTQLRRRCIHLGELVTTMNFLHEIAALNRHWRDRMDESRSLVSQQLDGLALILRQLGEDLQAEATSDASQAEALARELDRRGFPVRHVAASHVPNGKTQFVVTADACDTGEPCREVVAPAASSLSGQALALSDVRCGLAVGYPECSFRLSAPRQFDFKMGVAQARKSSSGVSGDSYLIRELPGDRLAAVLSDGTGAGPRAAEESRTALKVLEELFRVGFDTDLAVQTVNSMLLLRSTRERFATLDLLTVDLQGGQARFVKVGAPPSYLRRGREVSTIHAANLPLGVVADLSPEGRLHTLRSGDLIVMATDGLLAASADRGAGRAPDDNWIAGFLREAGEAPPQEIADALVEAAMAVGGARLSAAAGGTPGLAGYRTLRDDVTVVALRFGPPEGA